jgi:type VI secretion system FHA domain protein
MVLVFDVIKNGKSRSDLKSFRFNQKGGVIGRGDDADYKLSDPQNYISGKHLYIEYKNGKYYAKDESTNGTFLKSPYKKLTKGAPYLINSSDVFILGDHELQTRFIDENESAILEEGLALSEPEPIDAIKELIPEDFLDDETLLGDSKAREDSEKRTDISEALSGDAELRRAFLVGDETDENLGGGEIRGTSDHLEEHFDIPRFSEEKQSLGSTRLSDDGKERSAQAALRILENKLGVQILTLEPERQNALLSELADFVLIALDGLSSSLKIKEQTRREMRLPTPDLQENNPIKLGRSASNLLQNAEIGERIGLLKLSVAASKSFAEIDAHAIALHGAAKNAIQIAAAEFAPKNLEYQFESTGALKGLMPRSCLAWKAYRKTFERLNSDPAIGAEAIMPRFAKEYERLLFSVNLAAGSI